MWYNRNKKRRFSACVLTVRLRAFGACDKLFVFETRTQSMAYNTPPRHHHDNAPSPKRTPFGAMTDCARGLEEHSSHGDTERTSVAIIMFPGHLTTTRMRRVGWRGAWATTERHSNCYRWDQRSSGNPRAAGRTDSTDSRRSLFLSLAH